MPKVSVVMPAYNAEKYIEEAIDSILNQTFSDFEFIIINDGSTDQTEKIIVSYIDSRIIYLKNEKNSGIVVTLNKGLAVAKGEYIARMDSDDISLPERFEKQVQYMDEYPNVGVLGTGITIFGENIPDQNRIFTTNDDQLKAELIFSSCIAHPTAMIRRSVLDQYHLIYNSEFAGAEDYCLWWSIAKVSSITTISDCLLKYRMHTLQITKKKDEKYYLMMNKLKKLQFSDFKFVTTSENFDVFMKYCNGGYNSFTLQQLEEFIDCLCEIKKHNEKEGYFNQSKLKWVFELAILLTMNNSINHLDNRKEVYRYAIRKGMFTWKTRLKVFYHNIFKS